MSALLQSREFWTLIVGSVVSILVALVPQLEGSKAEIISAVMVLVGVIITTFGAEKSLAAYTSGSTKIERVEAAKVSPAVKS